MEAVAGLSFTLADGDVEDVIVLIEAKRYISWHSVSIDGLAGCGKSYIFTGTELLHVPGYVALLVC